VGSDDLAHLTGERLVLDLLQRPIPSSSSVGVSPTSH